MNITNSTDSQSSNHFEGMIVIGFFIIIFVIYKCCFSKTEIEEKKRFEWGVQRAQLRIQLRQDLSTAI